LRRSITFAQEQVAADLIASGLAVEKAVAEAPPGAAIIEDADRFGADLIVVGARKKGPIAAALLGSVSIEIMDGAPCSVLVSRGPPVERVLLATDGSVPARTAVDIVTDWPLFASAQIRVLGITAPPPRSAGHLMSGARVSPVDHDVEDATRATIEAAVGAAVDELTTERRDVDGNVRIGDPHTQIVAAAREWRTDLVVIGATGQSPLRSILLGSVARHILHRVSASVLVARRQATRDAVVLAAEGDVEQSR
jgi:nucleotide-binding universal stress UspA family protein